MATTNLLFAGFGGQGILFAGKFLAYKGLIENRHVSWLPSYGPEMRGGEANCSVMIADEPIGSPLIKGDATAAVFMNIAAYHKSMSQVEPGGTVFVNSSLVEEKVPRDDVQAYYLPVSGMAEAMGNIRLANIIMLGALNEAEQILPSAQITAACQEGFGA